MDVYNPSRGVERMTWGPLDDVVMGGCSKSELSIEQGKGDTANYAAVFRGNITSANNGGFASVRTKNINPPLDLSGYDGLKLRIDGDGQRYKFMLRPSTNWDGVGFSKSFDTVDGWQDVYLPFNDFVAVFRAKSVESPPPLALDSINSLQVMLSKFEYDGALNPSVKMGRFELPIESIKAYKNRETMPHVVLVNGKEEDKMTVNQWRGSYTIIDEDPNQTAAMKSSSFVDFCIACLTAEGAKNAVFKEKKRSPSDGSMSMAQLLDCFEQQ